MTNPFHPVKVTCEDSYLKDVAVVVDGLTGHEFSLKEYERRVLQASESRKRARFIMGPIPVQWLERVIKMGKPSALSTGIALFDLRGLNQSDTFKIEPARFKELGIGETARRRGLRDLVSIGAIKLESRPGRAPVVSLLGATIFRTGSRPQA